MVGAVGMTWRRDAIAVTTLLVAAMIWGTWYSAATNRAGARFTLYDFSYGPAVMVACGRGYINPDTRALPTLDAFLRTKTDRFDCATLPSAVPEKPLIGYQRTFRALMLTMAGIWAVGGVSWSGLAYLSGALLAVTAVLAYGTARLLGPWWVGAAVAVWLMMSPLHLAYLSDFRNYPKAPAAIALGLLIGVAMQASTPRRLLYAAIAFGAALGLGLGFRQDLMVFAPAFVLAVTVGRRQIDPRPVRSALMSLAAATVVCVVVLGPQLSAYAPGGGASVQHVATLGLMSPFDDQLGVSNGSLYEWGYYNEDSYASATLVSHGSRFLGMTEPVALYGLDYDRAGTSYWTQLARTFPADLIVRGYASALRLVELPSSTTFTQVPAAVQGTPFAPPWEWRGRLLSATSGWWLAGSLLAVLCVSASSARFAIVLAVLMVYLLAFPALQFHERHYFYLDLVPLLAAVHVVRYLITAGWTGVRALAGRARPVAITALVLLLVFSAPLAVARAAQRSSVEALLTKYEQAPAAPALTSETASSDVVSLNLADPADISLPSPGQTFAELFVVTAGGAGCGRLELALTLRYQTSHANPDFTRTQLIQLARPPALTRVFVPAFSSRSTPDEDGVMVWYRPIRFEVAARDRACVQQVARAQGIADVPVLVSAVLPDGWRSAAPFQTLREWERRVPLTPAIVSDPPALALTYQLPDASAIRPWTSVGAPVRAEVVTDMPQGWRVSGRGGLGGTGRSFYLAEMKGIELLEGDVLIAEGRLLSGGLSLGLVRDGRWASQVAVTREGPFVAVAAVPATGRYDVILANHLDGRWASNNFLLSRFGFAR
jgi:hypothetical protein